MHIIKSHPDIKVSFGVFDGIKQLAENPVTNYRGLRVLQEIKSSFIPSFADAEPITNNKQDQ
jgi:hypothetical protein